MIGGEFELVSAQSVPVVMRSYPEGCGIRKKGWVEVVLQGMQTSVCLVGNGIIGWLKRLSRIATGGTAQNDMYRFFNGLQ